MVYEKVFEGYRNFPCRGSYYPCNRLCYPGAMRDALRYALVILQAWFNDTAGNMVCVLGSKWRILRTHITAYLRLFHTSGSITRTMAKGYARAVQLDEDVLPQPSRSSAT